MDIELKFLDLLQTIHHPFLDTIMVFITRLGDMGLVWILLAIILFLFPKTRKVGIILGIALCINFILCNGLLKHTFARTRPCDINRSVSLLISRPDDFSFPSGHTSASFAAVTVLYMSNKKKLFKISFIIACFIAFSRMYLYVHYPSDIIGGIIVGVISGYLGHFIVEEYSRKKYFFK